MSDEILDFYRIPGPMSTFPMPIDPADLPDDLPSLVKTVQGLLLHVFWAERYGLTPSEERKAEVNLRSFAEKLPALLKLDPAPLTQARPLEKRLLGNCRDFSDFLAAMLKLKGIPARSRCGFGAYFNPGTYEDHWVAEYWNEAQKRWVMVDAQLDELQQKALNIHFNTLDVPQTEFITGGNAWRLCRRSEADAKKFGIFDMRGLWFIRGDLMRDFLALNSLEILPWDGYGLIEKDDKDLADADLDLLDRIAELTLKPDASFSEIRSLYTTRPELQIPASWLPA
jgi:Transglutaminase-like enzymes, putative cysteine proteases